MKIKHLVLGPGGMGFFAMLGVYARWEEQLKNLEAVSGSSAGSIMALFIALGKTSQEILDIAMDINLKELAKYNIKTFLDNYGLVDHSQIREKLISICDGEPRFEDLKMKMYVSAFNVNLGKTEYFSSDTHPGMSVIDAICMSISVPVLFSTFKWNEFLYIDGGTMEAYPALPFLNEDPESVLIIRIITNQCTSEIKSFKGYIDALIRSTLRNRFTYSGMFPTISVDVSHINIFNFNMTEDEKLKLFFMYNYNK